MHGQDALDRLHLDDELLFDEQIDPVHAAEPVSLEYDGKLNLPLDLNARPAQYQGETFVVGRLEQPSAEALMDVDCRADSDARDVVVILAHEKA